MERGTMEEKRCYGCMKIKSEQPVCEHCGHDNSCQNASHQLPAGTVLKEQYLIGKVLGQGGFGITYLGWDLYLDIPVAIKEYFPAGTVMRETSISMDVVNCGGDVGVRFRNNKERFMREAKMLARFSQVAEIVQIKNFFLANNTAYIVMEYIEGITLKQYVKNQGGSLPEPEILELMEPVILALCKIHKAGLVHRDISPDNIMMLPEKIVKLLDFGAVRDVGEAAPDQPLTKSTEAILKQGYAPIEQYQNRGSLGPWTDVYALCATMYYCATGEVPPDAPERLLDERTSELHISQISSKVEAVIKHGMALRTQDRISSMEQLYEELFKEEEAVAPAVEESLEEENQVQEPINKSEKQDAKNIVTRWLENKRLRYGGILLLVAAITGLIALLVLFQKDQPANSEISGTPAPTIAQTPEPTEHIPQPTKTEMEAATETPTPKPTKMPLVRTGSCGKTISWEFDTSGKLVLYGEGAMPDYDCIWTEESEGPAAPWSGFADQVRLIEISEGITEIGAYAFAETKLVGKIELPSTLEKIGECAFWSVRLYGTYGLEIPEKVTYIGWGAFENSGIKEVVFPEALEFLGGMAFGGCTNLKRIEFRNPNTNLEGISENDAGVNPFTMEPEQSSNPSAELVVCGYENSTAAWLAEHYGLTFESLGMAAEDEVLSGTCNETVAWELNFTKGVLTVTGTGAIPDYQEPWKQEEGGELPPWYDYMEEIRTIVIGEGITRIGVGAFVNPSALQKLILPTSLTDIGEYSFAFAENAFSETGLLEIPEGVTTIHPGAFSETGVREVILPESLNVLGHMAFGQCRSLRRVELRNAETELEGMYFGEINPFTYDTSGDWYAPGEDLVICGYRYSTAASLAEEYRTSGVAFEMLGELQKEQVSGWCGDSVEWEFNAVNKTLTIFGEGAIWYYSDEENLPSQDLIPMDQCRIGKPGWKIYDNLIEHVIFEEGVSQIYNCLLTDMLKLKTIDLGTLEWACCAFHNCPRVEELVIPESMTVVAAETASRMSGLKKVIITGASEIQDCAFAECPALEEIWFSKDSYLGDAKIFMAWYEEDMVTIPKHVVFYVYEGSDAERYAKEWNISYVIRKD